MIGNEHADAVLMHKALDLARAGIGLVSPNPAVGALIADPQGRILGTGTYTYDGVKHAEIRALEQAGASARGATLYLNLEPCSHQGRTPACADAVVAAGIARVVASMQDPNPLVSGEGFARLRAAGIQVDVGLREEEARRLIEAFAQYIRRKLPLVTLKAAMTLDGKIAPPPEKEKILRRWAQAVRAEDGLPARKRVLTCRNCGTSAMRFWWESERSLPMIRC